MSHAVPQNSVYGQIKKIQSMAKEYATSFFLLEENGKTRKKPPETKWYKMV